MDKGIVEWSEYSCDAEDKLACNVQSVEIPSRLWKILEAYPLALEDQATHSPGAFLLSSLVAWLTIVEEVKQWMESVFKAKSRIVRANYAQTFFRLYILILTYINLSLVNLPLKVWSDGIAWALKPVCTDNLLLQITTTFCYCPHHGHRFSRNHWHGRYG